MDDRAQTVVPGATHCGEVEPEELAEWMESWDDLAACYGLTGISELLRVLQRGRSSTADQLRLGKVLWRTRATRLFLPLSFSDDHRAIHGAEAARFMRAAGRVAFEHLETATGLLPWAGRSRLPHADRPVPEMGSEMPRQIDRRRAPMREGVVSVGAEIASRRPGAGGL